jgi:hypothetical protein
MRFLIGGLGGGLDVVNSLPLYFAAKAAGHDAKLVSIRRSSIDCLGGAETIVGFDHAAYVTSQTTRHGRFVEAELARILQEDVLYLARDYERDTFDSARLRREVIRLRKKLAIDKHFMLDTGGDALVLREGDAIAESEEQDPFEGGDALVLSALAELPETYVAVAGVGLDVNVERFHTNRKELAKIGAYFGHVNLATNDTGDLELGDCFRFSEKTLAEYLSVAERILVLEEGHREVRGRVVSHTAVSLYNAVKGNYGRVNTFAGEYNPAGGFAQVGEGHRKVYFFRAGEIERLKREYTEE